MSGHSPEEIRKETRTYIGVFIGLLILTVITVLVGQLETSRAMAIAIALFIASIKGGLVAAFFMHLISERKLIYAVLVLTVFFFAVLMWGPWHHRTNAIKNFDQYEHGAVAATSTDAPASHTKPSGH